MTFVDRLGELLAYRRLPWNAAAFALRQALHWRRGCPELKNESKDHLFDYLEGPEAGALEERHAELRARYDLQPLFDRSTRIDYRENLYFLDALEILLQGAPFPAGDPLPVADVGSKNWSYVFALERFFRLWGQRPLRLTGVEVDGYGVYLDFYSRRDYAEAYVRQTGNPEVRYRVADFLALPLEGLHIVTLFYPFLNRFAMLHWGLPLRYYAPEKIVGKAVADLVPGGLLVSFHQTRLERDAMLALLQSAGAEVIRTMPLQSRLVHYFRQAENRWAILARKA